MTNMFGIWLKPTPTNRRPPSNEETTLIIMILLALLIGIGTAV